MKVTLKEAARLTSVDESKIWKHMRHGWLPAKKDQFGEYRIETDDLFRVFPPVELLSAEKIEAQVTKIQEEVASTRPERYQPPIPEIRQRVHPMNAVGPIQIDPVTPRKARSHVLVWCLISVIALILGYSGWLIGMRYGETIKYELKRTLIHVLERTEDGIGFFKGQLEDTKNTGSDR